MSLFVGNVPANASNLDIQKLFEKYGSCTVDKHVG